MVENQQTFVVIQNRVVMRETLVVPHIIEGFQNRDAGLQDSFCHCRLKVATFAKGFHILAKDAM
ncbi:hypothetical protein D3C85_1926710 [compost metagenome]